MSLKMYRLILVLLILCSLIFLGSFRFASTHEPFSTIAKLSGNSDSIPVKLYTSKISEALRYCRKNKMDTCFAIFIDYSIHSGKKRAFLLDLQKDSITDSLLVSHGCGDMPWGWDYSKNNPQFSNDFESHRSSLGKFKIGARGYSSWGINVKYILHGLEITNSNALKRIIVMHGWGDVSDHEVYPNGTPEGWGCPAFSNSGMTKIDSILQNKKKAVLLWGFK